VRLLPGSHLFQAYGGGDALSFAVDARGNVSYDAALDQAGILSGQGSSALTVNGVAVTISSALSSPYLAVDYYISETPGTHPVRLLPGSHLFQAYGGGDALSFTVDARGNVSYDPALGQAGILGGQGSSALTVNGVAVTINAQALRNLSLALDYYISETPGTFLVHLLPGSHLLQAYGGGQISFVIDRNGKVNYDSTLEGILAGQGTSQLTVNGATVTVDALSLSDSSVVVDYYTVEQTNATFQLVLLPGTHTIRSRDGSKVLSFTVDASGFVDYDPSEDQELGGRGTRTLIVRSLG
jgi:hypothetical protein